ncbi:Metalloproteases (zincins), catalytic [Glarea lozoyensis ATCC 20868]|uniref:Metalloproteases (Zincins), catalytic n=1 Tax=Glarea lozoyensis (strain ATCC 20868 / MF5171) TaxID=1116229 RepID=S3CC03_GLAL2|nr:Metalloproteases (zincins), catalytic [Glarea lozoyensis ATCC 20868]EPE24122.1 Metalloproteases (zincins), catalytic [Glarea lozoyensis ATCC 20868]
MHNSVLFVAVCLGLVFCSAYTQASSAPVVPQSEPAEPLPPDQAELPDQTPPEHKLPSSENWAEGKDLHRIERRQIALPLPPDIHIVDEDGLQDGNYIDPKGGPPFPPMSYFFPRTFLDPACDKEKLLEAWEHVKQIVEAQTGDIEDYDYNLPHSIWLGDEWNAVGNPVLQGRSEAIAENLKRIANLFNGVIDDNEMFVWRCTEPLVDESVCFVKKTNREVIATTAKHWNERTKMREQMIMFCPLFFQQPAITDIIRNYFNDQIAQRYMENFYGSTAQFMLHEMWHWGVVSDPPTLDYKYGIEEAYELARTDGTKVAYVNADSYTYDGLAIYIQQAYFSSI